MSTHETETEVLVVGGGQAGIAMSEHLTQHGIAHVVLERDRLAERWRSMRWDSLVMNGPAWHDRFPSKEFDCDPDDFPAKEAVADYLEAYAHEFGGEFRTGVEVTRVEKASGRPGFLVVATDGNYYARFVVAATGPFQKPAIPPLIPDGSGVHQIHSSEYHRPDQLPEGNVLVIGAGSSGVQIAEELQRAGRQVYLAVGPHDRPPRSYRARDFVWWLGVLNLWERATPASGAEHVTIAVSGADGGHTVDFRQLAEEGVVLVGKAVSYEKGKVRFAEDLRANVAAGDANYLGLLHAADDYIARNGLALPLEPEAHEIGPDPECLTNPLTSIDLAEAGVTSIIWATGFVQDYSWLQVDALDDQGRPDHERGISTEPGVFFLGLPWQSRRGSSFIWGVWHDAKFITDHIMIQRGYRGYQPSTEAVPSSPA